MNLGDGLLFELENGKPKLILLSHGVEKNSAKLQVSCRSRAAKILSSRQPSCVEEVHGEERPARQQAGRHRETRSKAGGADAPLTSNTTTAGGRSSTITSSKAHEHQKDGGVKAAVKVKSDRHKHSATVSSLRANEKSGHPQNSYNRAERKAGPKDRLANGDTELKDSVVCLTNEQLQRILNKVQTTSNGQGAPEEHRPQENQAISKPESSMNEEGGGKKNEEDRGGGEEIKKVGRGGRKTEAAGSSQDKDDRLSGCLFSWLEECQSESRAALEAKKASWKRELDEQVALKQQQRSAPGRLQAEEDAESLLSVQSSISHRDQPAAIRSSLKLGEVTPMEEVLSTRRKEEQKRRWLEELDQQREETTERRRREKLLQNQAEDHELWATHFDSLRRRPPFQTAAPSAPSAPSAPPPASVPSNVSERGEWEPSSSLSLVWEAMSSCGAESVGGASEDTTSRFPTRASHLRTMTALLDPAQIEERERRRLKQLEQQRAIEAQVEERQQQREREEAKRREEEAEEERRVELEREMLRRRYELDTLKERQKEQQSHQAEQPIDGDSDEGRLETTEPSVTRHSECLEEFSSSASPYRDTAVQTDEAPSLPLIADRLQTPPVSAQYQPPPPLSAAPPNSRSRTMRGTGKENICVPGGREGGDPYEAFARTERSKKEKRRPEWNTQRPSRQFVPASERYPASLQRNRQESRMKRQAELLSLQERTCLSRTNPPPPLPPLRQHQESRLCSNPTQTRTSAARKVENLSRGQNISASVSTERGRSPPAVRHRVQNQQAPPSHTPPPPVQEFVPYIRTDEVFNLDPLEPADTPPPHTHAEAPPQSSASPPAASHQHLLIQTERHNNAHTQRQQEILRGLAQLRQGLLQKRRELETDLNPLLKRHHNELR